MWSNPCKLALTYKSVDVAVDFDRSAESLLRSDTEFWLVKPRVSLEGITGLGTLVAGDHIAMRPADGRGRPTRKFKALTEPPPIPESAPGLHLILNTKDLASVQVGSPVYYKRIAVGEVQSYKLVEDEQQIAIRIYIHPQYSSVSKCAHPLLECQRHRGGRQSFRL